MNNYKSIFGNIFVIYGQLIISSILLLFSTRYQLINLGEKDFGLFNLIIGFITALSFLNLALSVSTQRYLSYYLGKDKTKLLGVFNNSFFLHLGLGIIVALALLISKNYLFTNFFKLESDQIAIGKDIFLILILNIFFTIIAVPYNGTLISLNKIRIFSLFSILEAISKFAGALLLFIINEDKLLFNSWFITISYIIIFLCRVWYCKQFNFTHISFKRVDKGLIKEMFNFSFWNMFGAIANISRNHGLNILLNLFFGTVINAAYAIANQLNNLFQFISSSITKSVSPLITKEEGSNNRQKMIELTIFQCKISYILMLLLLYPLVCDLDFFLEIWLKNYPDYTVIFCSLIFIITIINSLTLGLQSAIQSVGKIKKYQLTIGILLFMNVPIGYTLLYLNNPPYYILIASIIIEIVAIFVRVDFANKLVGIEKKEFYKKVLLPFLLTFVMLIFWYYIYNTYITFNVFLGLIINFLISLILIILVTKNDSDVKLLKNKILIKFNRR